MDIPFIAIGDILHVGRHPLTTIAVTSQVMGGMVGMMWRGLSINLNMQSQICVYRGIIFDIMLVIPIYISTYVLTWNIFILFPPAPTYNISCLPIVSRLF